MKSGALTTVCILVLPVADRTPEVRKQLRQIALAMTIGNED